MLHGALFPLSQSSCSAQRAHRRGAATPHERGHGARSRRSRPLRSSPTAPAATAPARWRARSRRARSRTTSARRSRRRTSSPSSIASASLRARGGLSAAILKANRDVIEIAKSQPKHKGMGTTVVAACFSPRSGLMHVGHVGDSRCYRLRGGHLELLTQDHSLLTDVLEQRPDLDDTVLERLPKNIVTRALGIDPKLRISLRSYAVVAGRSLPLCSDGLSGPGRPRAIAERARGRRRRPTPSSRSAHRARERRRRATTTSPRSSSSAPTGPTGTACLRRRPESRRGARAEARADPELLILGIEELESLDADSASDDLLRALEGLVVTQAVSSRTPRAAPLCTRAICPRSGGALGPHPGGFRGRRNPRLFAVGRRANTSTFASKSAA